MLRRVMTAVTVVSAMMLSVLLVTTTPSSTGPLGILGMFVFMYLTALGVLTFLFHGFSLVVSRTPLSQIKRLKLRAVSFRSAYYRASVVALAPVMIIALQSVGQVGFYQVLLILFFLTTAWIYIANRTS